MRDALVPTLLVAASLLLILATAEVGVRLFVPRPVWTFHESTQDWGVDESLGWVNRGGLDVSHRKFAGVVRYRTNPDGLVPPDARRERVPGRKRVMVFGDSMVVGRDVRQDRIYTARLEALLGARGLQVEVINAGVLGYSTDQALLLMERWVPVYRPDLVLYGSTVNDFGGNAVRHANSQNKPSFELDAEGGLVYRPPDPARRIRPGSGGPRRWVQSSALYRWLQPRIAILRARLGGWEHRNLFGLMQELYVDEEAVDLVDWTLYAALVRRMQEVAGQHGAAFMFFAHPEVAEVWPPYMERISAQLGVAPSAYRPRAMEDRLARLAQRDGVRFQRTIDPFLESADRGPFHLLPWDAHLSEAGHERLAEVLLDPVMDLLGSPDEAEVASRWPPASLVREGHCQHTSAPSGASRRGA